MASDPNQIIAGLLQGTGFGRTVADNQQQQAQITGLGLQNQGAQQGLQLGALKLAGLRQQQQQDQNYQDDLKEYFANPTSQALAQLSVKYPDKADNLKNSYSIMKDDQRQSTLNIMGSLANAAANNRSDLVIKQIQNVRDAERAKGVTDPELDDALTELQSNDPARVKTALTSVRGFAQLHLAAADPAKFADNLNAAQKGNEGFTLHQGDTRFDPTGQTIASVAPKPDYLVVPEGGKAIPLNGAPQLEGGGLASIGGGASGPAAGRGDVSRLINTDAGGGYVPDSVRTLGQFVGFGKALNQKGAKSSSAGTYQINGTTMAEFAPKALGPDWKQQPFNADTQDKVGEAIFNWAKQQPNPAQALKGRWVSLNDAQAEQLVQGGWTQARGTIAAGETGGGAGASASAPSARQGSDPAGTVYGSPKPGYQLLSPAENQQNGLDPNVRYQRGPTGEITALGGQSKAQLKPLPAPVNTAILDMRSNLRQVDEAIAAIKRRPQSIGFGTGALGDTFTQYNDPDGTDTRAKLGKIAGQTIHDVSGAAVTASEEPRFKPYVAMQTDRPSVAITKLNNYRAQLLGKLNDFYGTYSEEQGYRPFQGQGKAAPANKLAPSSGWGRAQVIK